MDRKIHQIVSIQSAFGRPDLRAGWDQEGHSQDNRLLEAGSSEICPYRGGYNSKGPIPRGALPDLLTNFVIYEKVTRRPRSLSGPERVLFAANPDRAAAECGSAVRSVGPDLRAGRYYEADC